MLTPVPPTECVRARESVSAQLDGELSELETLRLELHLRECPACDAWALEVRDATGQLRQARLEVPSVPIELPRRSRTGALALVGAAAAMAAAAAVAVLGSFQHGPARVAAPLNVGPRASGVVLSGRILADSEVQTAWIGTLRSGNVYAT